MEVFSFGNYLHNEATEIYVAERTWIRESKAIYKLASDSEERKAQEEKAAEAQTVYLAVMDNYCNSEDKLVKWYANINTNFVRVLLVLTGIAPFVGLISLVYIKRLEFLLAIINAIVAVLIRLPIFIFRTNSVSSMKNQPKMLKAAN